jgi:hypothetical protein
MPNVLGAENIGPNVKKHACCFTAALAFMFIWPVMAIRDAFDLQDILTTEISAAIYVSLWFVSGALALVGSSRQGVRVAETALLGWGLFVGVWFVNVTFLPIPLPHEVVYPLYAIVNCVAPFIVGSLMPESYLPTLSRYIWLSSLAFCILLTVNYALNPEVRELHRNFQFNSINPITQAAHLGAGLICLTCSQMFRIPLILRAVVVLLFAWQVTLTGSRGPIIGLMFAISFGATKGRVRVSERVWMLGAVVLCVTAAVALQEYLPGSSQSRLLDVDHSLNASGDEGGALVRVDPIKAAVELGMENPLSGSGLSLNHIVGFYSHNLFAQAFLETGMIGIIALCLVIGTSVVGFNRVVPSSDGHQVFLGALFVLYLIMHQFAFTAVLGLQFWFLAGIGARLRGKQLRHESQR